MPDRQPLYHFTTVGALRSILHAPPEHHVLRTNAAMPPRWADRRTAVPPVVWLTADGTRTAQRWAGVPDTGTRGLAYLDRAAVRFTIAEQGQWGLYARPFRQWALDYDTPLAFIEEFAKGGSTDAWYTIPREVVRPEWLAIELWNGTGWREVVRQRRADEAWAREARPNA